MPVPYERPCSSIELRPCAYATQLERSSAGSAQVVVKVCTCGMRSSAQARRIKHLGLVQLELHAACILVAQEIIVGRLAAQHLVVQVDAQRAVPLLQVGDPRARVLELRRASSAELRARVACSAHARGPACILTK